MENVDIKQSTKLITATDSMISKLTLTLLVACIAAIIVPKAIAKQAILSLSSQRPNRIRDRVTVALGSRTTERTAGKTFGHRSHWDDTVF